MKSFFTYILFVFSVSYMFFSCAQQRPPSGGSKDDYAPKLIDKNTYPKNYSTNFSEQTITLEFDEYFNFSGADDVIITPKLKTNPKYTTKGKKLIVELNNDLDENTTYTLNFLNSITDITENNDTIFRYVFSTGNELDSLSVSGKVTNALSGKNEENALVILYDQLSDSALINGSPKYYAITDDKTGRFTIANIKEGKYFAGVIMDKNKNFMYDLYEEDIAFYHKNIVLKKTDSTKKTISLSTFREVNPKQSIIKKSYKAPGQLFIVLNNPAKEISLKEKSEKKVIARKEINTTQDTISFWLKPQLNVKELDFLLYDGETIIDSISGASLAPKKLLAEKEAKLNIRPSNVGKLGLKKDYFLSCSTPIKELDSSKIILREDSVDVDFSIHKNDEIGRSYTIDYKWKEGHNYQLYIIEGAFKDIYRQKNDSLVFDFALQKQDYYGVLNLTIEGGKEHMFYQLINSKKKVYKTFTLSESNTIKLDYLDPDEYTLIAVYDKNKNMRWDTGDYLNKLQPEKTYHHKEKINIRSNWDLDQEIVFPK